MLGSRVGIQDAADGAVGVDSSFLASQELWCCISPGFLDTEESQREVVTVAGLLSPGPCERLREVPALCCPAAGRQG